MKKLLPLLFICLLLSACSRDTTVQPTASPTPQATTTPEMQASPSDSTNNTGTAMDNANTRLVDGTYAAEMSDEYVASAGQGWQDYLKITVTGGMISDVEFDSLKDGVKKSTVSAAEYPMNPPPAEWIPKLNEAIRQAEMPEAMDTISGATRSSNDARRMYAELLKNAQTGNTEIVVLNAE